MKFKNVKQLYESENEVLKPKAWDFFFFLVGSFVSCSVLLVLELVIMANYLKKKKKG